MSIKRKLNIYNHFPSLFDSNVLEKADSNRTLVELAPDAVDRKKFIFHTIFECAP